ncbi:MAG: TetR/AcrR family transcriptional regulator [Terriglobales bacterium]
MTAESKPRGRAGSRHQPEQTRAAILAAAAHEFAQEGVDGARTEHIASAAGVNKALLYYYFQDKESLYGAVLDHVFSGLRERLEVILAAPTSAREKILAYAGAHFDYVASSFLYPKLVQREMMRTGRNSSPHIPRLVRNYFRPLFGKLAGVIQQGIAAGEFRRVDPMQFIPSMIAVIVFYFAASPVLKLVGGSDPLSPERIAARRVAVLDFISAALFATPPAVPSCTKLRRKGGVR